MQEATHRSAFLRHCAFIAALGLLGAGCGGFGFAGVSAPHVGCRSREIVISDVERSGRTSWTATCRGKSYVCGDDVEGELTCREKQPAAPSAAPPPPATPPAPPAPPAPPPAAAPASPPAPEPEPPAPQPLGCQYDTQCKGDRLCVEGKCVDPPATPQ